MGAEDDSSIDNLVIDPGMNTTMNQIIGMAPTASAVRQELQTCSCGWSKVTSIKGLKIHQGRMKCLKEVRPGPRIDTYLSRKRSSQLSEAQWQDTTHSPPSTEHSTPVAEEGSLSTTSENLEPNQMQPAVEKNIQGYRPQVKWPKSGSKTEWTTVNVDLSKILNELRGTAEKKLDKMSDLIYSYGAERFGVKERKVGNNNSSQVQKAARNYAHG